MNNAQAWATLAQVPDPEVPVLSVVDLGIVREVEVADDDCVAVTLTPTYSGCPATEVIQEAVVQALKKAGARTVKVSTTLDPPWTTDWITPEAAEKLRAYGIAPPHQTPAGSNVVRFISKPARTETVPCPHCGSAHTVESPHFGSTACKALYKCLDCQEPFDYFKPY